MRTPYPAASACAAGRLLIPSFISWLGAAWLGTAMAADVSFVAVLKGQHFLQNEADLVSLSDWRMDNMEQGWWLGENQDSGDQPLVYEVFATESGPGLITSATVTPPGGTALPLARMDAGDSEWLREDRFASPMTMEAARPDGSHAMAIQTVNDGTLSFAVDLLGGLYPPVPHITNHAALQNADSAADIAVTWSPMGGGVGDFIMLTVSDPLTENTVYSSGEPGSPGALDGTATGTQIPSGTLQPARDYMAELLFVRVVDGEIAPVMVVAGYFKMTRFKLSTAGLPGESTGVVFLHAVPDNAAWGVPRDSAVAFHFSRPMSPAQLVAWTINGAPDSAFAYEWTNAGHTLLCRRIGGFPAGAEVSWMLDLDAFRDAANEPLDGTRSGTFLVGNAAPETPPDVGGIFVVKEREFSQTGAAPVATGCWFTEVGFSLNAFNRIRSATVTMAANGRTGHPEHSSWDAEFYLNGDFASKDDFDRFFPNGDYTMVIDTLGDGIQTITLGLGDEDAYPPAPVLADLASLAAVDPAEELTISWSELPGFSPEPGIGDGLVELEIETAGGWEVVWAEGGDLNEGGTSHTIPAGTLWPGRTYQAQLHFIRVVDYDTMTYPGTFGAAGFESTTTFTITTTGTPVMPSLAIAPNARIMQVIASGGEPGRAYVLETSSDFSRWLPQTEMWIAEAPQQWMDHDAHYLKQRFYRMRDLASGEFVQRRVAIQGTVWTDSSRATPAAGATVGTSLDGRTTVTDSSGKFFLETDTPSNFSSTPYTIVITMGGAPRSFGPFVWGDQPREQTFELN